MEYRFSYCVTTYIYKQIRSKLVTLDEIALRTLSRLVYFGNKPQNYCTEEEFNELNIYLSVFSRDSQAEVEKAFEVAMEGQVQIGEFFFKKWRLEIADSFVWAVTAEEDVAVKLYDFGTEAAKNYLLEKSKNYVPCGQAAMEKLLLEEDLETNNHLLLILSAYERRAEWCLPREVLLHNNLKRFLFYIEDNKETTFLDYGKDGNIYLIRENMFSLEKGLSIPLRDIGKERREDIIRMFQHQG